MLARRPTKGTKIERIWAIADEQTKRNNRRASRQDVIAQAVAEGLHPATASTQYNAWKQAQGAERTPVAETASFPIQIREAGRIVLPAELRAELGVGEGDTLLATVKGGVLRLQTRAAALRALQEKARKLVAPGTLVSDELIAERRAAAADE